MDGARDPTTVYCTLNKDLFDYAEKLLAVNATVRFTYNSINSGDPDGYNDVTGGGCDKEREGVQTLRLLSIEPLKTQ